MAETQIEVQDTTVRVEGSGLTVVMLHGWPDSPALWDRTVADLRNRYRCVRFAMPGFDLSRPPRPMSVDAMSVDAMSALIAAVVDAVSPNEPVTLLLHDWGCFFGYEYAARHSSRVARVVGADIGDTNSVAYLKSLKLKEKGLIAGYQIWLSLAWQLGRVWPALGDRMTRFMARAIHCPTPPERMGWQMNYPYAMQWFGAFGGLRGVARVDKLLGPQIPTLFLFGARKPFMFHSARWLAALATTPGCAVHGFQAGHWMMVQKPAEFSRVVGDWLDMAHEAHVPHVAHGLDASRATV